MQGAEESAREGAFQLDMTDEHAITLHDLLPEAYRSKERCSKKLKDLVMNLNRRIFIMQEELPNIMMTTQHLHTGEAFRAYLKKNNLRISHLRIYNKVQVIEAKNAPSWYNVWLTVVWFNKA
jgi:hypothetical protein